MPTPTKVKTELSFNDQVLNLTLNAPPGNVLDKAMIDELTYVIEEQAVKPSAKAIIFRGAGEHFSYGASIPEHERDLVGELLSAFHQFFRTLITVSKPCVALVRGQCLGGGLELAAFCHWIFASENAHFGQPEINLSVFAPVASLILPYKIGQTAADNLLLSGRSLSARQAHECGLVSSVSDDPESGLQEFMLKHVLPKSTTALKFATRSARFEMHGRFLDNIDRLERLYVEQLMETEDANEGIRAFMERRSPVWRNK